MVDGRIRKYILYGDLATETRPTGRPALRYKDVCKRDLKSCNINQQISKQHFPTALTTNVKICLKAKEKRETSARK
jgi:hypothetical protein